MEEVKPSKEPYPLDMMMFKQLISKYRPWFHSGTALLAALFWLSFVAMVFLIALGLTEVDSRVSGGAVITFFVLAMACSFSARGE